MIKIKNIVAKNFLSVGNASQSINFDRNDLTLVLGENLDLGGNGSRNGVGKSVIANALTYGLYGEALTNIKKDNLINKTNQSNMFVSVDFEINGIDYKIERGRKPNILKFYKNSIEHQEDDALGEMRETQVVIDQLLNISIDMFKHTVALNTYTIPFLSMRPNDQKTIIEQLLGITLLTDKALALKTAIKTTKNKITSEEYRLEAIVKSNTHIETQISNLKARQSKWIEKHDDTIDNLGNEIASLMDLEIEGEIKAHNDNAINKVNIEKANLSAKNEADKQNTILSAQYKQDQDDLTRHSQLVKECNKWIKSIVKDNESISRRMQLLEKDIALIEEHKCHSCGQDLHDEKQEENKLSKEKDLEKLRLQFLANESQEEEHKLKLADLGPKPVVSKKPSLVKPTLQKLTKIKTYYNDVSDAHNHKTSLESLISKFELSMASEDPYIEQIKEMNENGLQELDYNVLNDYVKHNEHQTFLLKLLTNKDSFIRKKIIEQNLSYLNSRLTYYLDSIGLPHKVQFMSDLTVEISDLGRELSEGNLSRGERTRLILSLSWAFRDVFESLYNHVNLLFVDELLDNGLDASGVESSIGILKQMARERNKSIWLVSHRDELTSRVHNTQVIYKSNGFTTFNNIQE